MGKFLYFGYGSNLLSRRIHLNNPSAVRRGIGKLQHFFYPHAHFIKDYRLDFGQPKVYPSHCGIKSRWGGSPATIVPEIGSVVWGSIWELDDRDLENLDDQENVKEEFYKRITVKVESPDGNKVSCISYCFVNQPERLKSEEERTGARLPSLIYMDVIIRGAEESRLPEEYISFLKSIPTNSSNGPDNCPIQFS